MAKHQEGEKYLQNTQSYIDRHDLFTIEQCLDVVRMYQQVYKESLKAEKLKDMPDQEKERGASMMLNRHLLVVKTHRYKDKEKTIQEWIQKDKAKQDKYNNTPLPSYTCPNCNIRMESFFKTLDHTTDDDNLRMMFFFKCPKCDKREGVYDNGKIRESKPFLCPECKAEATYTHEVKGKQSKWITKCTSCNYANEEIDDHEKWKKEQAEKKLKDKELLEKYRSEFCLDEKTGNEYIEILEAIEVSAVVKEEEILKYDNQTYADTLKLKKTTIPDLEKLLVEQLETEDFAKLTFEKPEMGQFVVIPFSIQDMNSERSDRTSSQTAEEIIKKTLNETNWRLIDGVSYRLGYLQGRLKGYEREEDMIKLVEKKKPAKPQKKVDPELYAKYANHTFVQMERLLGKMEGIDRVRKRRLEKEPEGFFLDRNEGPYQCGICNNSRQGNEIWWTADLLYCADCWRNACEGVIPKNLKHEYNNDGQWISDWQFKDKYGVHPATRNKYVREGFLKVRELKDGSGGTYYRVYLVSENEEFLKKHPHVDKKSY